MSRRDTALVYWKHYAYGYEARLTPYGKAFARARMVKGVQGIHYELIWIYGPKVWRPQRVQNLMTIERMVDRWVVANREALLRKMPPDLSRPQPVPGPTIEPPAAPDPYAVRTCPGCGRRWGMCDQTVPKAARRRGNLGWSCYRMTA